MNPENKEEPDIITNIENNNNKFLTKDSKVSVISIVKTPLNFFVLAVLIVEVIFGICYSLSSGNNRTNLIFGMLALMLILIIIVAGMAIFRPESLFGVRKNNPNTSNKEMSKNFLDWNHAVDTARKLITDIKTDNVWEPEIVIGLGRSGGIWGGYIAGNLGSLPFTIIDDKYKKNGTILVGFPGGKDILKTIKETYPEIKHVLIIEGASSRGTTFNKFKDEFTTEIKDWDIKYAVLYKNSSSDGIIHYVGQALENWPKNFPWHESELYRTYV